MTLEELKQQLQSHFSDRMVTVIGSGLSVAMGLPSMGDLAGSLLRDIPNLINLASAREWREIEGQLRAGTDLETALKNSDDENLTQHIRTVVASTVGSAEKKALLGLYNKTTVLPFSRLLKHLTFSTGRAEVITPNYDRLIEFGAELAGFGVDDSFFGTLFGPSNEKYSKDALSHFVVGRRKLDPPVRKYRDHIAIFKPHGSLNWYLHGVVPIRSSFEIDAPRLLITPGANKYRQGYEAPFDHHREAANHAIDNATRYLILGYGFNDAQLEQHLCARLRSGYPGLLLTRTLSPNAEKLLSQCSELAGLTEAIDAGQSGTLYRKGLVSYFYPGIHLWDLETFALEIFNA